MLKICHNLHEILKFNLQMIILWYNMRTGQSKGVSASVNELARLADALTLWRAKRPRKNRRFFEALRGIMKLWYNKRNEFFKD